MSEFRIEYVIQRLDDDDDDFREIGFGSSGGWNTVNAALYAVGSDVQGRIWETETGQPDPHEVDTEEGE